MTDLPATTINRAYRVRLRPKPAQERMLSRLLGAKRFVWNWAWHKNDEAWKADGTKLRSRQLSVMFTELRKTPGTEWLSTLPRVPFAQTFRDYDRAWRNFFEGRAKRPRKKKRGSIEAVRFTLDQRRNQVDRERGIVQIDGVGKVRFRVTEPLIGRLRSVTVRRDPAGRWFASFTADRIPKPKMDAVASTPVIGVDLGIKNLAALSTGDVIPAPKHLNDKMKRLRRYQRSYSRQQDAAARRQGLDPSKPLPKGTRITASNRMKRRQREIGRLHAQVADARRDHQHKLTHQITAAANVVAIEDLSAKAIVRGFGKKAFRRSAAQAGLGEIRRQLTYKAAWRDRELVVIDRFFPSSKLCGACGTKNTDLTLSDRAWSCRNCGTEHDRDLNAAQNIAVEGLRILSTPGSGGTDAREEVACAARNSAPVGQPISLNREPIYRAAKPRSPDRRGMEPRRAGAG